MYKKKLVCEVMGKPFIEKGGAIAKFIDGFF
jgi:hypothetical protein